VLPAYIIISSKIRWRAIDAFSLLSISSFVEGKKKEEKQKHHQAENMWKLKPVAYRE